MGLIGPKRRTIAILVVAQFGIKLDLPVLFPQLPAFVLERDSKAVSGSHAFITPAVVDLAGFFHMQMHIELGASRDRRFPMP